MNSNSIIKSFWPLLKLLQVFGGIPIKKSNDTACGFEALSFCQYLTIIGFVWLFAIAGNIFAWINIMVNHDKSAFELFQIVFDVKGGVDAAAMMGLYGFGSLFSFAVALNNFRLKNTFVDLMEVYQSFNNLPFEAESRTTLFKRNKCLFFIHFGFATWTIVYSIAMSAFLKIEIQGTLTETIIFCISLCFFLFACVMTSQMGFLYLFCEACHQLNASIKLIIKKIDKQDYFDDNEIIAYCSKLLKEGLEQTNTIFSFLLLWCMAITCLIFTFAAYFAIAVLVDSNVTLNSPRIGMFSCTFATILYVVLVNFLSQEVAENLQGLKFYLYELKIDKKEQIIEKINSFKGFNACGFFTLGKPLLTSIIANFITYMIVLIQFKMAENPKT